MFTVPTELSVKYPKAVVFFYLILTLLVGFQMKNVRIDTDPENMLNHDEPVRLFYDQVKEDFGIKDMIVLGIVRDDGVFQQETLEKMKKIVTFLEDVPGVIFEDIVSFTTSDNIESGGGLLTIHPIMEEVPEDQEGLEALQEAVMSNPMLKGKLASADGQGLAIYIPIEKKDQSFTIASAIEEFIEPWAQEGKEKFYIAGLPIAEDTFGHDMFIQMGISAPLAMVFIFFIMLYFFRQASLVTFAMLVAMVSVITTMGLLIGMGFTVHIMSSMIAIFLMPIAVIDSVHILSDFHDTYPKAKNRKEAILEVMSHLSRPMLFTSITSAVGFASLASTPIPPVRVFGFFVAFGILLAWFATITLIPAMIMLMKEDKLQKMVAARSQKSLQGETQGGALKKILQYSLRNYRGVNLSILALIIFSVVGIRMIVINDNPVNWFKKDQKIAIADRVMNRHFNGTYMANLVLSSGKEEGFKDPETANYLVRLQEHLEKSNLVGMTTGYTDVIKRVNHAVHDFDPTFNVIPKTKEELAQYIFLFLNSGNPEDLDKLVDYDFVRSNIWVQLKSGDNQDMVSVVEIVKEYTESNQLPEGISYDWAGLTYINVVWQEKMVQGMMNALIGSFFIVLVLMSFLFRSIRYGLYAMIPLTVTIGVTYGVTGFIGKAYDMPVAVLSSLALGLSVDFAIHFIEHFLAFKRTGLDTQQALERVFGAPVRAMTKNAVVISLGFTPLLLSPLIPYITVGILMATIMVLSTIATIFFLPSLLMVWPGEKKARG